MLLRPDLLDLFLGPFCILDDFQALQILSETSDLLENLSKKLDYLLFSASTAPRAVMPGYVSCELSHARKLLSAILAGEAPLTLHISMSMLSL